MKFTETNKNPGAFLNKLPEEMLHIKQLLLLFSATLQSLFSQDFHFFGCS